MRHNLGHQSRKTKDLKKFESHNALTKKLQTVYFQKKLNNAGILERNFFLVVSSQTEVHSGKSFFHSRFRYSFRKVPNHLS